MNRMLHSGALLLVCALWTGLLQAQLEEDFTPHPANWILANGYSYHTVNGNDVILSSNGSSPGTIGTPEVKKTTGAATVNFCFDIFGYTSSGGLGALPCAATYDLFFTNTAVNNSNQIDESDPNSVYGSVKGLTISASGGTNCNSFTFPASVTATSFRVFLVVHDGCAMGSTRYAFDNFVITGLSEVCTGAACAPVALPDVFNTPTPGLSQNVVLYGNNPAYPAAPAGYMVYAAGIDNDPNDAYSALTWSLLTPPSNGTVTMNPGGQGTATVTRSSIAVTQMTFVYQLCDPDGNCDTAAVTVNFGAGAPLPVTLMSFTGNRNGNNVTLRWTTTTETDNVGFEVQRIVNGDFKAVGFVNSKAADGTSSLQQTYSFTEVNLTNAVSWYRLVQVNKDGTKKILPSLAIRGLEDLKKMLIYPNPGSTVNVLFGSSSVRDVSITDLGGKLIKRWNSYSDDNITITGLQTGMYMFIVYDKNTAAKTVSKLIIKR
ncbi:T9SS type A sorting domain-containing protein [Niastella vici]|nr:T9SS type A sorting domain-containing protein [Niastella vici]